MKTSNHKILFLGGAVLLQLMLPVYSQGTMQNFGPAVVDGCICLAPTRLGSIDGPLAGPEILAQLRAGETQSSLQPVGTPFHHGSDAQGNPNGVVVVGAKIPFIPWGEGGFTQAAVWDGSAWGEDISEVASNQFGYTEVREFLGPNLHGPIPRVFFEQAAIVPPIPEPELNCLLAAGLFIVLVRRMKIPILAAKGNRTESKV